jgi:hypothetical protein
MAAMATIEKKGMVAANAATPKKGMVAASIINVFSDMEYNR